MSELQFVLVKERSSREQEQDKIDSCLEQSIRDMVYRQVLPVECPADSYSGYELDHYDFDDPEQFIQDMFHFIKDNFKWKRRPVTNKGTS